MVDFGESDKIMKISGKADKSNTTGFVIFHSLFKEEWNIITKHVIIVWFIHFSTYFYYKYI